MPLFIGLAVAAVLLAGTAGGVVWAATRSDTPAGPSAWQQEQAKTVDQALARAQVACDANIAGTEVADNARTLIIDTRGKDDYAGAALDVPSCVLGQLQAPQAVLAHMGDTRALDGRQEDQWQGYTASWTYHPDSGLDMIIRKV